MKKKTRKRKKKKGKRKSGQVHKLWLPSMPNPLKRAQARGLPSHVHVLGFNQKTRPRLSLEA
jgi:hypothetical protein